MNDRISLNDINFRFAFSIEGYHSREMKNDPRYVKYLVRVFGIHEGKEYERLIPYHKCTDSDWAQFAPPKKSAQDGWQAIKDNPKRGMFCLDMTEDIELYGKERNDEYQRIEVALTPCNYVHTHLGYQGDSVHPECVADLEKQKEYLGPLDILIYHTEGVFKPGQYGIESIIKESNLKNQQIDEQKPNWVGTEIM